MPDSPFFIGIAFRKILDDVKLHVASSFRSEAVDGVNIADRFEGFIINTNLFFDLDNAAAGMRVRLKRMAPNRPCG